MKSYIMLFSPTFANTLQVTDLLDQVGPNWDWHRPMDNTLCFTSDWSAQQLVDLFMKQFGSGPGKFFLIMEASPNKQGWLTERAWRILNNPNNPRGK